MVPMIIEFVNESDLAFHESCAAGFCVNGNFVFMPDPSRKRIGRLGQDLSVRDWEFFKGDQADPAPYRFERPLAVAACPEGGFYVCDGSSCNLLFFDRNGIFEYAKSPPGILEVTFERPVNLAADIMGLAVVEEDMRLHLIEGNGQHRMFHLAQLTGRMAHRGVSMGWHNGRLFILPEGESLMCLDPVSGLVEEQRLSEAAERKSPAAFCFDPTGRLYLATSDPAGLMVLAPGLDDVLAEYERFGYQEGCIRHPRCLVADDKGFVYLIDDSRIMLFHLAPGQEAGEDTDDEQIVAMA
jgi:hypothetical protein